MRKRLPWRVGGGGEGGRPESRQGGGGDRGCAAGSRWQAGKWEAGAGLGEPQEMPGTGLGCTPAGRQAQEPLPLASPAEGAREGACLGGEVTRAAGASEGGEALCQHQAASEAGVTVRPLWRRAPRRPQGPSFLPGVLENYRGSGHALGGGVPQAPSSSPPPPCTAPVSCRTLSCPTPPPTGLQAGGAAGLQLSVPPKGRARSWAPLGSGS